MNEKIYLVFIEDICFAVPLIIKKQMLRDGNKCWMKVNHCDCEIYSIIHIHDIYNGQVNCVVYKKVITHNDFGV